MTELQCLLKVMMVTKLPKEAKEIILERIGQVEEQLSQRGPARPTVNFGPVQSPSTQRLLDEMATQTGAPVITTPIAQTPAAAAALESRQLAIKQASSGKPEPGRTSPRKF